MFPVSMQWRLRCAMAENSRLALMIRTGSARQFGAGFCKCSLRYLLQLPEPAERDRSLGIIGFVAAAESPYLDSLKSGAFN